MNCSQCRQPLTQVGQFWICPAHGQFSLRSSRGPQFAKRTSPNGQQIGGGLGKPNEAQTALHHSSFCLQPLRIFLSYGHDSNEELVRRIKADLEKRGHEVRFDKNEIKFSDEWRRAITDGILQSNRVLPFLSKHSTRDPGVCLDEFAMASA